MHLAANVARVLVVEDDPADAETTCTLLRRAFCVTSGASPPTSVIVKTLAEACQATQVERFDLAVVDMGLPDSDGVATVAALHACAPDVPLIVITGTDEDTVTGETFAAGAQDYLVKGGFDAPLLRRTIRHALERHRASAERDALIGELRSILEHIPDMIFMKDAEELRFVRFNRAGEQLLGYSRNEMIGKNDFDLFRPKQASLFTERDREVLRSGSVEDIAEEPIDTAHGVRWLHTKKIPVYDTSGKPRFLLGISEDITERKTAHDALRRLN
ncbi:MAG: PAS domain-containing protein, partial [Mycobacterium sp.]